MTKEKLNPSQGDEMLNPGEGDGPKVDDSKLEKALESNPEGIQSDPKGEETPVDNTASEQAKEQAKQIALEEYNKLTGKNYKSFEDIAKSEQQRDSEFAKNPKPKVDPLVKDASQATGVNRYEELTLIGAYPESKYILDELREQAKGLKKDVIFIYENSEYYQNEAKARFESAMEREKSAKKVANPSSGVVGEEENKSNIKLTDADKEFMKRRGLKEEDIKVSE